MKDMVNQKSPFYRLICWTVLVCFTGTHICWAVDQNIEFLSPPAQTYLNKDSTLPSPANPDAPSSEANFEQIEQWIGSPMGKGKAKQEQPLIGEVKEIRIFTRDGELTTKRVKTLAELGSGFTGTVYKKVEVDEFGNETGKHFVEKYYSEVKPKGFNKVTTLIKAISLKGVAFFFKFFRGTPLSYRINLWAVLSNHYANLLISEVSQERFGKSITPRLLYSRYDESSGSYVQAYEMVRGQGVGMNIHQLRLAIRNMREWFRFLEKDLGLIGIARQTNIRTLTSLTNVRIDEKGDFILLDMVGGVVGVPWEIEYWLKGILTGNLPIFSDAVNYKALEKYVAERPQLKEIYEKFKFYTVHWSNSEPLLFKSPLRPWRLFKDETLRKSIGENLLLQLEYKGILTPEKTNEYRRLLAEKGKFPQQFSHSVFNLLPLFWHQLLLDPEFRLEFAKKTIVGWIDQFQARTLRTEEEAAILRRELENNNDLVELLWLFSLQRVFNIPKPPGAGILAAIAGILTGHYWLISFAFVDGMIRTALALGLTGLKYPRALILGIFPIFGGFAVPLELRARHYELSRFIVEAMTSETISLIPGLGERGGLLEIGAMILAKNIWENFYSLSVLASAVVIFPDLLPAAAVALTGFIIGSFSENRKVDLTSALLVETLGQFRSTIAEARQNPTIWNELNRIVESVGGTIKEESTTMLTIKLPVNVEKHTADLQLAWAL